MGCRSLWTGTHRSPSLGCQWRQRRADSGVETEGNPVRKAMHSVRVNGDCAPPPHAATGTHWPVDPAWTLSVPAIAMRGPVASRIRRISSSVDARATSAKRSAWVGSTTESLSNSMTVPRSERLALIVRPRHVATPMAIAEATASARPGSITDSSGRPRARWIGTVRQVAVRSSSSTRRPRPSTTSVSPQSCRSESTLYCARTGVPGRCRTAMNQRNYLPSPTTENRNDLLACPYATVRTPWPGSIPTITPSRIAALPPLTQ